MLPASVPARPKLTRDLLLRHASGLSAAPQVLGGLCELLEDVNTGLDEVADQIRLDPALAARVLRLSNSIVFGGGWSIASIEDAVNRVGFAEITRLVGAATVTRLVDRALPAYGLTAEQLRESLLLHALASEALAGLAGADTRVAYTCGLLRGIGLTVLQVALAATDKGAAYDPEKFSSYTEWERAQCGVAATEVTVMVLDHWRFPAEAIRALEQHLELPDEPLAAILNLAGGIVAQHGHALPGETAWWAVTPAKLAAAELGADDWTLAGERTAEAFARQRAALY
jgi:HD-like signal output (HDOD) protein